MSHDFSIETSEAQRSVHVLEANGRNMSGARQDGAMTADSHLNGTAALGLHDQETDAALNGVLCCVISVHFHLREPKECYFRFTLSTEARSSFSLFFSEFQVFNIVIIALALCILTVTGLYCVTVCYNRTR